MDKIQGEILPKSTIKGTDLGKTILEKYTPKKDLNRKAADYIEKHITVKSINRFETCSSWMHILTNAAMSIKKIHKCNRCGNRFCPICTWVTSTRDAIKISIILEAIREVERKEFLFLTLTAPNCSGEDLREEIDRFNKGVNKLFKRRSVVKIAKGYVRKLEVTTDQEPFITEELYKRKKDYYDMRGLSVGNANPTYNTYHPHLHLIVVVDKSYFDDKNDYITKADWLSMWQECMNDKSITQVDAKKVSSKGNSNAVLEIAKYSAKGSDLYHSETVFDTFYMALKKRQLVVYSGLMKDYMKKLKNGSLDNFKKENDDIYTHLMKSIWKISKYENKMRELTPKEFEEYNERALKMNDDEDDE